MSTWNHNDLTVATGVPDTASYPVGYVFAAQGTQHVVYIDANGTIYELWWDTNGWHQNNLTAATGTGGAHGEPAAYVFDAQGTQHVVYVGVDSDVHELWWDPNGWHHADLTAITGAPGPANAVPVGYVFAAQGTQHVVYVGVDSDVHELWWDPNGWHHADVTVAAGGAPPAASDPYINLAGYVFEAQGTQHVLYRGTDNHVHELWWDPNGWHHADLTAATGAPGPADAVPVGYVFEAQGTQHVVYVGVDSDVHELWWDPNGWHHADLTAATGAPGPADAVPVGYVFEAQGTQHVVYVGVDSDIHELWWDTNGWHHNDLTAATGAPPAASDPDINLAGYVFEDQGTQHVIYRGADNHVHELWSAAATIAGMAVFLDPGHNGANDSSITRQVPNGRGGTKDCETTGTATSDGYPEHSFNWDVVLRIRDALSHMSVRTELSRDNDSALGPCIDQRAAAANAMHPDAIVSIHADGAPPSGRGFHVNYSSPPLNDAQAGPAVQLAIVMRDSLVASGLQESTYIGSEGLYGRADLAGLNLAQYPAILIELGNMKNSDEAAQMESADGRAKYAAAVTQGIVGYLTGKASAS